MGYKPAPLDDRVGYQTRPDPTRYCAQTVTGTIFMQMEKMHSKCGFFDYEEWRNGWYLCVEGVEVVLLVVVALKIMACGGRK